VTGEGGGGGVYVGGVSGGECIRSGGNRYAVNHGR